MEEFAGLVLTETATAAKVQETLKLETLPIKIGSTFFFLVLSVLLMLRSNKPKHLAADEGKKGEKVDGASWLPKPKMWCARYMLVKTHHPARRGPHRPAQRAAGHGGGGAAAGDGAGAGDAGGYGAPERRQRRRRRGRGKPGQR